MAMRIHQSLVRGEIELSGARVCINKRNEGGAVVKIAVRNRREDERS
jgi:hypothetical protein